MQSQTGEAYDIDEGRARRVGDAHDDLEDAKEDKTFSGEPFDSTGHR
jgi:hypothetical protein